jgi:cobalt-precorrin-5B (C1)-methyltransferase
LAERRLGAGEATAAVVKDAGDDPDVTHGCLVRATVRRSPPGAGVTFHAGEGVGTVTRAGLQLPPGEPAINPVPRQMMRDAVAEQGGVDVAITIAIPGGEALAAKTLNARLGIVGGLSILGTTGVVVPYSCSSWIHSIHRGIDVARAAGLDHVAAATGSTSERAVRALHGLPEMALLDMGDFVGGTLKYLRRNPVPRLSLAGGFAKLAKLAQGHLDLHSSCSRLDQAALARLAECHGATQGLAAAVAGAHTASEALALAEAAAFPLGDLVAAEAQAVGRETVGPAVALEVIVVDRQGGIAGRAAGW